MYQRTKAVLTTAIRIRYLCLNESDVYARQFQRLTALDHFFDLFEGVSGGKYRLHNSGCPYRGDPVRIRNNNVEPRTMADNTRITIAVVEEIGEAEDEQRDQPPRVQGCEREPGCGGDDDENGKFLDPFSAGEEPDDNGVHTVDKVPQ